MRGEDALTLRAERPVRLKEQFGVTRKGRWQRPQWRSGRGGPVSGAYVATLQPHGDGPRYGKSGGSRREAGESGLSPGTARTGTPRAAAARSATASGSLPEVDTKLTLALCELWKMNTTITARTTSAGGTLTLALLARVETTPPDTMGAGAGVMSRWPMGRSISPVAPREDLAVEPWVRNGTPRLLPNAGAQRSI